MKKFMTIGLAAGMLLAILAGCGSTKNGGQDKQAGTQTGVQTMPTEGLEEAEGPDNISLVQGMVYRYNEDAYLFLDLEEDSYNSPFSFSNLSEDQIFDENGNQITEDDLKMGDVVELSTSGGLMECFPPIYETVSKMEIIKRATPEEAQACKEKYQEEMSSYYTEPDPSEKPVLQIIYSDGEIVTAGNATMGSYAWSWPEGTETQYVVEDMAHILSWTELAKCSFEGKLELQISKDPDKITAKRWPDIEPGGEEMPEGEVVEVSEENGTWYLPEVEKGYRYLLHVSWGDDYVEYGFVNQ